MSINWKTDFLSLSLSQLSADITGEASRLIISRGSTEQQQFIHELDDAAEVVLQLSPM